jgi:K+-sensing histidine kinase KdpD
VPVGDACDGETNVLFSAHDLRNAITAISGAAHILHERWDELDETRRRELVAMLARRADEVVAVAKLL